MHFLKCLAIGIAVASGCVAGTGIVVVAGGALEKWLTARFGARTTAMIFGVTGLFILITTATLICYLAPATHN